MGRARLRSLEEQRELVEDTLILRKLCRFSRIFRNFRFELIGVFYDILDDLIVIIFTDGLRNHLDVVGIAERLVACGAD